MAIQKQFKPGDLVKLTKSFHPQSYIDRVGLGLYLGAKDGFWHDIYWFKTNPALATKVLSCQLALVYSSKEKRKREKNV